MAEEKSFQPTLRKLRQAREKGQVAKSRDLVQAGTLLLVALLAPLCFAGIGRAMKSSTSHTLGAMHEFEFTAAGLMEVGGQWALAMMAALLPLFLAITACGVLLTVAQAGPLLSFYPLNPRFEKINPIKGLRRIFSLRSLVETVKSMIKVGIVGIVAYLVLRGYVSEILMLGHMGLDEAIVCVSRIARELSLKVALVMVVLGLADLAYQRYEHTRDLRMTHQEMKQETKDTDGDPQILSRRRQRRAELLRDGISPKMPEASVVLTNPTHVAVALYYDPAGNKAPVVVARGRGNMALRIKKAAWRHGIIVREEPLLARSIYRSCPLGAAIPASLYQAVAVILAEIYREAQRRREQRKLRRRR